ncbi:right-handed parallel beta-helix repeat-containing protein [Pontiella sp.]|uniref:right-handed parallel beta-helix repeat-containing protein n=1 Tax=Pontiella sp. TaxID=2837462 RepID=UPI0035699313
MKKQIIALAAFAAFATHALAQGSLTPPGAPAPTMKTLSQIEARTPISAATTITQPGSYYLTAEISVAGGNGITISADEVTLDLNGFTIRSTAVSASGYGIFVNGTRRNIAIANGFIKGGTTWNGSSFSGAGFNYGIVSFSGSNITVSEVVVERCYYSGIYLWNDGSTAVASCTVRTHSSYGIVADRVESSIALECGSHAISANQVTDCRGSSVLSGFGISAERVRGSYGRAENGTYGISATTAHDSYGYASSTSSSASGISATTVVNSYGYGTSTAGDARGISASTVNNCYGYGTSTAGNARGIYATTVNNCYGYGHCTSTGAGYGIDAESVQNSYGYSGGDGGGAGYGIDAHSVGNSRGLSTRSHSGSRGIAAEGPVADSYAYCAAGHAIDAESAENCRGESTGGNGIHAGKSAMNCVGISSGSYGLSASTAGNCYGAGTRGITATVVNGCYGTGSTSYGILGTTVNNSYGFSTSGNSGLHATIAQNAYGFCESGSYGLYAGSIAIGCYGSHYGTGTGIYGYILNSCRGYSASGTAVGYSYKYNMP